MLTADLAIFSVQYYMRLTKKVDWRERRNVHSRQGDFDGPIEVGVLEIRFEQSRLVRLTQHLQGFLRQLEALDKVQIYRYLHRRMPLSNDAAPLTQPVHQLLRMNKFDSGDSPDVVSFVIKALRVEDFVKQAKEDPGLEELLEFAVIAWVLLFVFAKVRICWRWEYLWPSSACRVC